MENRNHREFCKGLQPKSNNTNNINNTYTYNNRNQTRRRNIKAPTVRNNKRWTTTKTAILTLALATLGTTIAVPRIQQHRYETTSVQEQIKAEAQKELIEESEEGNFYFDGSNFATQASTPHTALYKVLENTDIDEIVDEYIKKPTPELKAQIEDRIDDLVDFNVDTLRALFADGENTSIDNVNISMTLRGDTEYEQEKIMRGQKDSKGWTLRVNTPNSNLESRCGQNSNYNEIPRDLFTLISQAKIAKLERDPNVKLKLNGFYEQDIFDRALQTYKETKTKMTAKGYNLSTHNGTTCLKTTDGKYYNYENEKVLSDDDFER